MSDDEYMSKKHNPDMSDAAWDKRWEQAKQVKQKAREKERKKLLGLDEDGEERAVAKPSKDRKDDNIRDDR